MIQSPTSFLIVLILLWCKLVLSCFREFIIALQQLIQVLLQIINSNLQSRLTLWHSLD
ncbi:3a protein [Infectious bronchitis virus]|uniref:Non-structural protein 3a n=4 Tax=Infectious bronchitis virus TaxID=11120 RepID=NS3A_IBVB|nr:3a protein [Infectious bronchitis virus]P30237.2 RecName: Full=Non-structural protein 3a; Short=ns3a; AltName: Full=Accessory protein 3a; Flags: Precursor [Avian infectious bronchitis virus (strain Beaudette)]UNG30109.1 3a protein [Avian coronavirus]URN97277.1 3a protein [Vector pBAC-Beaudette-FU]CAC39115.1 3a protein [Avian infectious bronchitis virus (strain Beaudette CK)]CAC39301.1 3a protein [Avian infectious bronchitis virus (strain Beaudette US)]BDI54791.1 3a protein [synthetic const